MLYIIQYITIILSAQLIMNSLCFATAIIYFLFNGYNLHDSIQQVITFVANNWKLLPAILVPVLMIQIGRTARYISNIKQQHDKRLSECWLYFAYMTLGVVAGCIINTILFYSDSGHFLALVVFSLLASSASGLLASFISAPLLHLVSLLLVSQTKIRGA